MLSTDRRSLIGLGAGLALAAPVLLSGCSSSDHDNQEEQHGGDEVTANEDLMREHGVLRRIPVLYREVAPEIESNPSAIDAAALARAANIFRTFGEHYPRSLYGADTGRRLEA